MKTLSKILFFMSAAIIMALPLAAGMHAGGQNSSQNRRGRRPPPPPIPPSNSNQAGVGKEPTGPIPPITCSGMRPCTAEEKKLPPQVTVEFPGPNGMKLHGHLYVPGVTRVADLATVTRKYPAMIYNHGSDPDPDGVPSVAKLYLDHGYIFFAPDRHGQGLSKDAGKYQVNVQQEHKGDDFGIWAVLLEERYNLDVIAAVEWFKKQPYVEPNHIGMAGLSLGGIQTLITARKDPGIRAYVVFAPAAMSWGVDELVLHLKDSVTNERAPMFIIQAEGDYNLGPVKDFGDILFAKGNHQKWGRHLYPQFGCTNDDAHRKFAQNCDGIAVWGQDVIDFVNRWVKN
jgi:dienelactone hydrolase